MMVSHVLSSRCSYVHDIVYDSSVCDQCTVLGVNIVFHKCAAVMYN
jgi:hypothetical protein